MKAIEIDSKPTTFTGLTIFIACILLSTGVPLDAADHQNLEEGLPAEVEDAYPIGFRGHWKRFTTSTSKDWCCLHSRFQRGATCPPDTTAPESIPHSKRL
jgi:hypothetical protein